MDTFFELLYYIGIIAIISMLNTQEPAYAADLNSTSEKLVQVYDQEGKFPLKKAAQHAKRLSECEF